MITISYNVECVVRRHNSTSAEDVAKFQRLFSNPNWLTSSHQKNNIPMNRVALW